MSEKAKFVSAGTVAVVAAAVAGICHFEGHRGWACVAVAVAVLTAIFAVFAVRRHLASDRQWVIPSLLQSHFAPVSLADLRISQRSFPLHIRVDVQRTLERLFEDLEVVRLTGVRKESAFFGVDFSDLTTEDSSPAVATAPQYEDVDVGDQRPIRCLKNGLWLLKRGRLPCALLMTQVADPCGPGSLRMEWATPDDAEGAAATEEIFRRLEQTLADASCYRGKVLSFVNVRPRTRSVTDEPPRWLPRMIRGKRQSRSGSLSDRACAVWRRSLRDRRIMLSRYGPKPKKHLHRRMGNVSFHA